MDTVKLESLPRIDINLAERGPELHPGMKALEYLVEEDRTGHLRADVHVPGATVPVVMSRSDLYVLGFESSGGWWRFSDAQWPFDPSAKDLGHTGSYGELGGLRTGAVTRGTIEGIGRLRDVSFRPQWRESLRSLLVTVPECARLIPVRMQVLGVLNGIDAALPLHSVQRYIQDWSAASRGKDMSEPVNDRLRVGFNDPTIIRR